MQQDGDVEVSENLPLLAQEVERDREDDADGETPQQTVVHCTGAEHHLWSKGAPEDGSGKVIVDGRTGKVVLLINRTYTGDLRHLVIEDGGTDESGDEGGEHLAVEGDPRWNVDVMGEFHILREVEGVRGGDVPVGFEVEYRSGVTGEPEPAEHLGEDVEGDLHVGNCHDDATGNREDHGKQDTIQCGGGGGVCGISGDTSGTKTDGNAQDKEVGPLGNLSVRPHQTGVDVFGVGKGRFATDQVLEPGDDLATVVQDGVSNNRSIGCEVDAIDGGVTGRQTRNTTSTMPDRRRRRDILGGRIGLVGYLVE